LLSFPPVFHKPPPPYLEVITIPIGTGGAFLKSFSLTQEPQLTGFPCSGIRLKACKGILLKAYIRKGTEKRGQYSMENVYIKPQAGADSARS